MSVRGGIAPVPRAPHASVVAAAPADVPCTTTWYEPPLVSGASSVALALPVPVAFTVIGANALAAPATPSSRAHEPRRTDHVRTAPP